MLVRPAQREYRTFTQDSRYWAGYRPRASDVVIATAPKCGTTWTQQIVCSLVFQDPAPRSLPLVSPWVEARFRSTAEQTRAQLEGQTHRRFLKTHLPIDGLPLHDEVKYIHVARDGRDAVLSMHNHFSGFSDAQLELFDRIGREDPAIGRPYPRPPADAMSFFRDWIGQPVEPEQSPPGSNPSFFWTTRSYWSERTRPNLLLVHYGDLSADLDGEMRRIAEFLEIEVEEAVWPSLVRAAGFEAMKAAGDELMPQARSMFPEGARRFFHKGESGRWKSLFTDEDLAAYETKAKTELTPGLIAWLQAGRRGPGDPRTALE
ncbi:MAG TPA: sulfotransferase domain-containing protein [Polyangiales bacterium]|nr:sulfotransferase domain-containing protein [Polyangiales bacterium]